MRTCRSTSQTPSPLVFFYLIFSGCVRWEGLGTRLGFFSSVLNQIAISKTLIPAWCTSQFNLTEHMIAQLHVHVYSYKASYSQSSGVVTITSVLNGPTPMEVAAATAIMKVVEGEVRRLREGASSVIRSVPCPTVVILTT